MRLSFARMSNHEMTQLRAELERMTLLRQEERVGRTRAEKALRELRNAVAASEPATGTPTTPALSLATHLPAAESRVQPSPVDGTRVRFIGHIHSVYRERNGTPNQPQRVPASRAVLVMDRHVSLACSGGFDGLAAYSHVWITFLFHGNTGRAHLKAKVTPPRHGTAERVGIWACRSPHRVNELGLSLCEMVAVDTERGLVHLRGVDLIHNTPVVDIKPFIPAYDTVPAARVPAWVQSSVERAPDFASVVFTAPARAVLECICRNKALPPDLAAEAHAEFQLPATALRVLGCTLPASVE
jgi:tRNA-Thr(GGU) m(6)t(6)A37 methyltransferase TsaA